MTHATPQSSAPKARHHRQSSDFPLEKAWIYKVTVLSDLVARRVTEVVQRTSGLNLSQWRVIAAIADTPGSTATQVVHVTPMDKGIVSRAVSSLVERGLVERRASNSDGRLSHLYLTESGLNAYNAILAGLAQHGADGLTLFSADESQTFLALLNMAIERYRQTPSDA